VLLNLIIDLALAAFPWLTLAYAVLAIVLLVMIVLE